MSKVLFIVTSAIHTKFGIYSTQERIEQTIETFNSIKRHMNSGAFGYNIDYDICLIECGQESVTPEEESQLEPYVTYFIDYTNDEKVKAIAENPNWDVVKSSTEMLCFSNTLELLKPQLYQYNRVFKLSGRYALNANFNALDHVSQDKIVFAKARDSQFTAATTGGMTKQYMTRLWSWPTYRTDQVIDAYNRGVEKHVQVIASGGYVDIEHLLYYTISSDDVAELPLIGVSGNISPNGVTVND